MEQLYLRPREKLIVAGAGSLSVGELLQILIGSGVGAYTSASIARSVQEYIASCQEGAPRYDDLVSIPGVGPAKACTVLAALELGQRMAPPC